MSSFLIAAKTKGDKLKSIIFKGLAIVLATILIFSLITGCAKKDVTATTVTSTVTTTVKPTPIVLKVALITNETDPTNTVQTSIFEQYVYTKSEGRITFENYYSGALMGAVDSIKGLGAGTADIALIIPTYAPADLPLGTTMDLPFMFNSTYEFSAVTMQMFYEDTLLRKQMLEKNIVPLFCHGANPYNLIATKPVQTVADFKGLKIRAPGGVANKAVEALGGTAVSVPVADWYSSLQSNLINGFMGGESGYGPYKLTEVAPYYTKIGGAGLFAPAVWWAMNKTKWDSLGADLQKILTDASYYTAQTCSVWGAGQAKYYLERYKLKGYYEFSATEVAKAKALCEPLWSQWASGVTDGQKSLDEALARINAYRSTYFIP